MKNKLLVLFLILLIGCDQFNSEERRVSTGFKVIDDNYVEQHLILGDILGGSYYIEFLFRETTIEKLRSDHSEVVVFDIVISDGYTDIERSITFEMSKGNQGRSLLLFKSPKDFRSGVQLIIDINFSYNTSLLEYYNELNITLSKFSGFLR